MGDHDAMPSDPTPPAPSSLTPEQRGLNLAAIRTAAEAHLARHHKPHEPDLGPLSCISILAMLDALSDLTRENDRLRTLTLGAAFEATMEELKRGE